jgi:hypothetical protein
MTMFDDLHDPNPPQADSARFAAVATRAKQLRRRRFAASGGAVAVAVLAIGGAVVVGLDDGDTIESNQPTVPVTSPSTVPSSVSPRPTDDGTAPPGSSTPSPLPLTCAAVPADATVIVADGGGEVVAIGADGESELPGTGSEATPTKAVRGADGTIWVESAVDDAVHEVHRIAPDGTVTLSARGDVKLSGVGELDGRTAAVIIDSERPDGLDTGGSILVEFADGERVDVAAAVAPEYGAESVTIGAGRLVEGAVTDQTESFRYYGLDNEPLDDWVRPTDAAPYNAPPYFTWPVAADVPSVRLSWVEGPDFDGATNQVRGRWALVVSDAVSDELLRVDLGPTGRRLLHADFDGRFWVGTFDDTYDPENGDVTFDPARVMMVDTLANQPVAVDIGCPPGSTATLDHFGRSGPEPDPPGTDSTTPPTGPPPPTLPSSDCGVDTEAHAIVDHIDDVASPNVLDGAGWTYGGESNYDPCAALSYARLDVAGGTGSSPAQFMLFHDGEFVGTATECAFGLTSVIGTTLDSITVEYRWPRAGDPNAAPSGLATMTYRWNGQAVDAVGDLPVELQQVNGCAG